MPLILRSSSVVMHAVYHRTPKEATTVERRGRIQETFALVDKLGGSVRVLLRSVARLFAGSSLTKARSITAEWCTFDFLTRPWMRRGPQSSPSIVPRTSRCTKQDPLDLSSWLILTFLHNGIEEVERHLL